MKIVGELKGRGQHRTTIKSPVVTITDKFQIDLVYNDCPVTLFYKSGNHPWQSMLINNIFRPEAVPRYSDVYLMSSLSSSEKILYEIEY